MTDQQQPQSQPQQVPAQAPVTPQSIMQAAASSNNPWTVIAVTLMLGFAGGGGLFTVAGDRETAASVRETKVELAGEMRAMTTRFEGELRALSNKVDDAARRTASIEGEVKEVKAQVTALQVSRWTREDQDRFKAELDRRLSKLEDDLRAAHPR